MSKSIYGLTDLTNEAAVEVIRRRFLSEADTNPHLYHTIDVERCRSEDWQIERFLLEKGTHDEAFKALVSAVRWKKSFGIHERDHKYFPKELVQILCLEKYSWDREGRLCSWAVQSNYKKIREFTELIKQFQAFAFEHLDREAGNKGIVAIADSKGISYSNTDISLAKFSSDLAHYYPQVIKLGCNLDLPWIMVSLWKLVRSFFPRTTRDKIILIKREELPDYIDIDPNEFPVNFGGNRETMYAFIDDMLPLHQLKHLEFTDKQIDNFYKVYNFEKNNDKNTE